jgi:hypothetical protein
MSKIVELKIGEIENVVGGVNAVSVNTANAKPIAAQSNTLNAQIQQPQVLKPGSSLLLARFL